MSTHAETVLGRPWPKGRRYPTCDMINDLPEPWRRYVHDLQTRCDPSGDLQRIAALEMQVLGLVAEVRRLDQVLRAAGEETGP